MELLNNFKNLFISVWEKGILGVNIFEILIGIGIFFIFLIFRGIISKVIIKRLEGIAKKTTNKLDDTFVYAMEGPARFLPIVIGFFIASYYISFSEDSREIVDTINRTLITIFIFWVIHQVIEPISYILSGLNKILTRELIGWIIKSLKILIFILGLAAVLELWGIKIGPIIAGLGLFGVAVALGAQDLFKNLISGILVLVEKRFKIGDWILVDGIIAGLGGIVIFVPQIAILFAFIAFLEHSGYMARLGYLSDRVFRSLGLSGRSTVSLVGGLACAVPAIMAARTIPSKRSRLLTILVTPLMTCSARLPVYAVSR